MIDHTMGFDKEVYNEIMMTHNQFTEDGRFYNASVGERLAAYAIIRAAKIQVEQKENDQ